MKSENHAGFEPFARRCHTDGMTDKPKRPRDANQLAKFIVDVATGDADEGEYEPDTSGQRKGGLKGGKARAEKLSRAERTEISKTAAGVRWKKDQVDE